MDASGKVNYSLWGKPAVLETAADVMMCLVPIWVAITVGLIVGWSWKPRWVSFILLGIRSRPRLVWQAPPGLGARRFWLAMTAVSAYPMLKEVWTKFSEWMWPLVQPAEALPSSVQSVLSSQCAVTESHTKIPITDEDLSSFMKQLDEADGGPAWQLLMERSATNLKYQAWRREPETGPTEYRSRTVLEDVSPALMRDFFWDDEFRVVWDDMLIYNKTWEECKDTGFMITQWVRKYPFFCKDREYILGRRIWESNNTYYCITQGVPYPAVPLRHTPRRVDVYFSSWRIRAVESAKGDGQLTACEVMLFHHEEMGIQRDLAKLGVRQGMWGCVKKIEPGIRIYQAERRQNKPLSPCAMMAHIMSKVPSALLNDHKVTTTSDGDTSVIGKEKHNLSHGYLRWMILGGAVALACGVERGAVGKFLVFGVVRRLGRLGRRL
ncbi:hypothetical protein BDL97_06G069900 [Sphagnum fallax]|nr:hypothetical protein BDL97_06G069900 [Sphagnum fallax]KAH8959258.1 hypothetical protein BDL97_06G069900 [Sphagnum fallax]